MSFATKWVVVALAPPISKEVVKEGPAGNDPSRLAK